MDKRKVKAAYVDAWGQTIAEGVGDDVYDFLGAVNRLIDNFRQIPNKPLVHLVISVTP